MTTAPSHLIFERTAEPSTFVLGHRPELDGLRGISILLVLALHLGLDETTGIGVPGGFLGVDIFFVLSGFLITTLLVQEYDRTGSISLKGFYLRRALRLGPALAVLIPLVCIYSLFTVHAWATFIGALMTLSYVANWFYAFKMGPMASPFTVTWSLAIEEQFYLIWPLSFMLLLRSGIRRGWILGLLVVMVALVAVHRFWLTVNGAGIERLYLGTDTRADGLLIGCIFGLLLSWGFIRSMSGILPSICTALLALCILFAPHNATFYYLGGLTAVSLSVGIIIAKLMLSPSGNVLARLKNPVLVWIGKVSYGLYLWHVPVIKFTFPQNRNPSFIEFLFAITLSFLFTALSYYLVEKRFLAMKDRIKPRLKNHRT